MKKIPFLFLCAICLGGCMSARMSARYGDGTQPLEDGKTEGNLYCRYYIRSFDVQYWFMQTKEYQNALPKVHAEHKSALTKQFALIKNASVQPALRNLVRAKPGENDIPLDIEVRIDEPEMSGLWTFPLLFTYVLPMSFHHEYRVEVKTTVGKERQTLTSEIFTVVESVRMAMFSPLGLIPFSEHEEFQFTKSKSSGGFAAEGKVAQDFWGEAVSYALARQLKKHALERLKMPEINFEME